MNIRIGIVGYGNLARGVEASVQLQPDMELVGVFSRRQGIETVSGVPTYSMEDILISKVKSMLWFFVAVPQQTLSNKHQW